MSCIKQASYDTAIHAKQRELYVNADYIALFAFLCRLEQIANLKIHVL